MSTQAYPSSADIVRRQLPNGITVLVREHPHVQSVVISGSVNAGAIFESLDTQGLVSFTCSSLMRGTVNRDFAALHEELELMGASLHVNSGMHHVRFGGKALAEDLSQLLDLLADVLRNPTFPQEQVERLRGEIVTGLKIRSENTRYMATRAFRRLAYPAEHPYYRGTSGEVETISAMRLDTLRAYHQQQFGPQGMILVIVGNVQADQAIAMVGDFLGDWQNDRQLPMPQLPPLQPLTEVCHDVVILPGKSQTDVVLGVPGPSRFDEDYQAARVANNIFGLFGMYGRLGNEIREKQGLAYYSYSQLTGGHGPGSWRVIAGVDPNNVKRTIESIRTEIRRMIEEPVNLGELQDSQLNLTGILPLQLESNEGVANMIFTLECYDLGLDYLQHYSEMIHSLHAEQLQQAMTHYWSADAFALGIAGPNLNGAVI